MPSPYPRAEGSPLHQITKRFVDVTVDIPQVPLGMYEVGDLAAELGDEGVLDWRNFGLTPLRGQELNFAITETVRAHRKVGMRNVRGLRGSLPFASDLVVSGLFRGIHAVRTGSIDTSPDIDPISNEPGIIDDVAEFMGDTENSGFMRAVFEAVRRRVAGQDIATELARYRPALVAVHLEYAGRKDPEAIKAKQQALNAERARLMRVAVPAVFGALDPFVAERLGVRGFARVLVGLPSPALFAKHDPTKRD